MHGGRMRLQPGLHRVAGHRGDVDAVDADRAGGERHESEQRDGERRLPRARPADDRRLDAAGQREAHVLEHERQAGAVGHRHRGEAHRARVRPALLEEAGVGGQHRGRLLRQLGVAERTLDADKVVAHLARAKGEGSGSA